MAFSMNTTGSVSSIFCRSSTAGERQGVFLAAAGMVGKTDKGIGESRSRDATSVDRGCSCANHRLEIHNLIPIIIIRVKAVLVRFFYGFYELPCGLFIHPDRSIASPFIELRQNTHGRDLTGAHTEPDSNRGLPSFCRIIPATISSSCWARPVPECTSMSRTAE